MTQPCPSGPSGPDAERPAADLGSVGRYTTTVKLDLEARGEIERMKGVRPQRWVRAR